MAETDTAGPATDVAPIESSAPSAAPVSAPETPVQAAPTVQPEASQWQQERAELQQRLARAEGYAQLGARYLSEQQRQVEAPKPTEPEKPWWASRYQEPQAKPYWSDYLTTNESGQQTFVENTPPEIQREYREHQAAIARNLREFGRNPFAYMEPAIERAREVARQDAREEFRRELDNYRNEQRLVALEQEHESWLYQTDEQGSVQRDAQGNRIPSQLGLLAKQYADYAALPVEQGGAGIQSLEARWQFVMANVNSHVLRLQLQQQQATAQPGQPAPVAPAQPVVDPAAAQRNALLDRSRQQATRAPNRATSPAAPARKRSFREDLVEDLKANGIGVN